MKDTKVQRYEPVIEEGIYSNGNPNQYGSLVKAKDGRCVMYADHTRIVAEKDAQLSDLAACEQKYLAKIAEQNTLLAKYQRLHAADLACDNAPYLGDDDAHEERRLAMAALA